MLVCAVSKRSTVSFYLFGKDSCRSLVKGRMWSNSITIQFGSCCTGDQDMCSKPQTSILNLASNITPSYNGRLQG